VERGLAAFAAATGVEVLWPADFPDGDFRDDPRLDFGRVVRRTPLAVLRPADQDQLVSCVRFFADAGIRYRLRGTANSSGGQALIDESGVVLDLRRLDRIVADDPEGETLTVEGGAWWLTVVDHLHRQGRRPLSVTANLRSSVGGTLAVGGFGAWSHLVGLQIAHVSRLALVTPDGTRHRLGRDDELFRFTMAGRGQLGIIAEATLETVRRPFTIAVRELHWPSLEAFVRDEAVITAHALYDFMRARVRFPPGGSEPEVSALVGLTAEVLPASDPGLDLIRPAQASAVELLDVHAALTRGPSETWQLACPALEFVLPLPAGLAAWRELAPMIAAAGIPALQPLGPSVMVVRADPRFPLAPTPADVSMIIVLRPELPAADAPALLPALRAIGRRAMELGARIYLMSIELEDPEFLPRQFGDALPRLRALKARVDPRDLLNPGFL
jgi:FAD/FMN-containing dehydrogenase